MEGGESHGQITEPGVSIRDTLTSYMRDLPITNQIQRLRQGEQGPGPFSPSLHAPVALILCVPGSSQ